MSTIYLKGSRWAHAVVIFHSVAIVSLQTEDSVAASSVLYITNSVILEYRFYLDGDRYVVIP